MTSLYVPTPIYFFNDVPHIGHVHSSTIADLVTRLQRLHGAVRG